MNRSLQLVVDHDLDLDRNVLEAAAEHLRMPLGRIGATIQVLQRTARLTPKERHLLDLVAWDARLVQRTSADLRDCALISSGRTIPLLRRSASMDEICKAAVLEAGGTARTVHSHGHALGEAGRGEWDSERLVQALAYLLEHALARAAPHGPVHLSWRGGAVNVSASIHFAPLSPGDTAPSAPPGLEHGMRLHVARGLILAHGGWLVRARSGRWRSFVLSVPRRPRERGRTHRSPVPLDAGSALVNAL